MKVNRETVKFYINDGLEEINKVLELCKEDYLYEEDFLPLMEHALQMFNAAFNFRSKSRKEIHNLTQEEWEQSTMPPKEIFG